MLIWAGNDNKLSICLQFDPIRSYYKNLEGTNALQGDPKGSERFLKNGCGIQMSKAKSTKFSMLFKHDYGQLF